MHSTGIQQKADNGIAMVEKREELNIKYYFSIKETRTHLAPCIVNNGSRLGGCRLSSLSLR